MKMVILDPELRKELIRKRRRWGADHHDEVWDRVYFMSPDPDNLHQLVRGKLVGAILQGCDASMQGRVYPGVNVSDQEANWKKNYRIPDVAVFLPGNPAQDRGTHWFGGPDFAVEIISRHDRARRKLPFYASVGVRELLLLDRRPWSLELYRLRDGILQPTGRSIPETSESLASTVLPLSFRLLPDTPRPLLEVTRTSGTQKWLI